MMKKIFEDLNKDLEDSISKKDAEEKEKMRIYDEVNSKYKKLQAEIFEKNFAKDFKRLQELYKKYEKGHGLISLYFQDYEKSLQIINYDTDTEINITWEGDSPARYYFKDIKALKEFKVSKESFHLLVEERKETIDDYDAPALAPLVRRVVAHKKFSFKDKKLAYEYFHQLFKKKILNLNE